MFLSWGDGALANNFARDLFNRLVRFPIEDDMFSLRIPVEMPELHMDFSMIYPHAIFAKLYQSYPAQFTKRFLGTTATAVTDFRRAQRDHPSYLHHPMHRHEFHFREKGVPLFLHGDDLAAVGVGKIWAKAVDCVSFGGLLAHSGDALNVHVLV